MTEPDFSPRPAGAEAAISAGRRRRAQRQLGSAGVAGAFALAAVLVVTHPFSVGGRGSDSLRVAGDPTASGAPSPGDGEPSTNPTDSSAPDPSPSSSPSTTDHGGISDGNGGGYQNPSDPTDEPSAEPTADTGDRVSPQPEQSTVAYTANDSCTTDPVTVPGQSPTWCVLYSGVSSVQRGGTAVISADLCRLPNTGDGTWTFSDLDGMAFQIDGSNTVWSSQDGRHVQYTAWSATVKTNTCLRFSTTWDTRDRDGFRVRPGDYYVSYQISGSSAAGGYTSSSSAGLTVTE